MGIWKKIQSICENEGQGIDYYVVDYCPNSRPSYFLFDNDRPSVITFGGLENALQEILNMEMKQKY